MKELANVALFLVAVALGALAALIISWGLG